MIEWRLRGCWDVGFIGMPVAGARLQKGFKMTQDEFVIEEEDDTTILVRHLGIVTLRNCRNGNSYLLFRSRRGDDFTPRQHC